MRTRTPPHTPPLVQEHRGGWGLRACIRKEINHLPMLRTSTQRNRPFAARSGSALIAVSARSPREAAKRGLAALLAGHGSLPAATLAPMIAIADADGRESYFVVSEMVIESLLESAGC